ncbi:hypothetical protein LIER_41494 [Lithospermum erythrorhizon]|uniref:Protein PHLOEM PROTEIN 2-LIKE A10 n=1 Tax=Lithospermum erythrorhizon TaxID=34254 RepID=A0AAV3RC83_LITER
MEIDIVRRGLEFSKRKKKWIIVLGLVGVSSYGAYRVYNMPSVVRKRRRIMKLLGAFVSLAEMVTDSAETMSVVSKDLKEFLLSDSDEIPTSIRQLSKITQSDEFVQSFSRLTEALTIGVIRGYGYDDRGEIEEVGKKNFTDKVMDRVMSSAGSGFVSVVVGSFARNLVLGYYASVQSEDGLNGDTNHSGVSHVSSNSSRLPWWVEVMCDEKCKVLVSDSIQTFVSTAVALYLDKTMDINFYDDMFSAITNPKHQTEVKNMLVSLCNGVVETLVKTSHQVLTSSNSKSKSSSGSCSVDDDLGTSFEPTGEKKSENPSKCKDLQSNSWVRSISSTLAVPSNRKFVLNVTGRVTLETIRSAVEFIWWKILQYLKRSLNVVNEEVVERGLQVIRYVGAKSSVIVTICFALFLHLLGSANVLLPA